MNVGIRKDAVGKEFVFFEVDGINLPQIKTYIEKLPQKTSSQRLLKTQAEQLFKFIMSQEVNGIRANTHIHPKNRSFIG
jgi:3-methyladenine DNA glycosylase/8-oxoguanine DNA glycosylase